MNSKKTVLITDDSKTNQELLTAILGDKYQYLYAENGVQLIEMLGSGVEADIILLDINMPYVDGFQVLQVMSQRHWLEETPVVVISAEDEHVFLQRAYALGAADYIPRPFSSVVVQCRVENTLALYTKQRQLVQLVEEQVYQREELNNAMIDIFSRTVELRNNESGKHTRSVHTITELLLRRLVQITDRYALNERTISMIGTLSSMHDIGKIVIPEEILNKPGKLTDEEFEIMKTHTVRGDEIIGTVSVSQNAPAIRMARGICRWHHERWDGRGYPDGLVGDEIPISAQAVSMADVYDALTSDRCYKSAIPHEQAVEMICRGECGAFNPLLVQCLQDIAPRLREISGGAVGRFDYASEAQTLTSEMLADRELPLDDRTRRLLANEREKKEFFKAQSGGIQFEYDCLSGKVSLTVWRAGERRTQELYAAERDSIHFLSREDQSTLVDKVCHTTRDSTDVTMTVLAPADGEYRWHRLTARTVWPLRGDSYICVLGQFTDIHDQVTCAGLGQLLGQVPDGKTIPDFLRNIFSVVRLVDPSDFSVLKIDEDGQLVTAGEKCYQLWNRDCCCENCSSRQAMKCKGIMTKLELQGSDLYSVISKYIPINGRDCVLEMAFSISDGGAGGQEPPLPDRTRLLLLSLYKDPLTCAYARAYLEDFRSGLEKADAVAVVDIDNFKHINDGLGHPVGDKALRHIAGIINTAVGDRGVVIRYGGDEFLLVFHEIEEPAFFRLLQEIKDKVSASCLEGYPALRLGVSIGGAYRAGSLTEAIARADREMYRNKSACKQKRD